VDLLIGRPNFQQVIQALAGSTGVSYGRAHAFVRSSVAALELVPYHSESFAVPDRVVSELRSVQLIKSYLNEILVPRAVRGEVLIVVTRKERWWD